MAANDVSQHFKGFSKLSKSQHILIKTNSLTLTHAIDALKIIRNNPSELQIV